MQIPNDNLANLALILFEKGIISSSTLATEFGIDYKKEQELMKFENDIKVSYEKTRKPEQDLIADLPQLIEQSRRNVEALTKTFQALHACDQGFGSCWDALQENVKILRDLTNLAVKSIRT